MMNYLIYIIFNKIINVTIFLKYLIILYLNNYDYIRLY